MKRYYGKKFIVCSSRLHGVLHGELLTLHKKLSSYEVQLNAQTPVNKNFVLRSALTMQCTFGKPPGWCQDEWTQPIS